MEEKTVEQEKASVTKRLGRKTLQVVKNVANSLVPETVKIPVEEINTQTVATAINKYLGNPVQQKFKNDRWVNPFSITDVLVYIGYGSFWSDVDYQQKFPTAYDTTRTSLNELTVKGTLEVVGLAEPDKQGEIIYYKVVDEVKLKDIATKLDKQPPS